MRLSTLFALLAIVPSASSGAPSYGVSSSGGITLIGTGPPPDTFVSFEESTTFGPGGTIFDYSSRISIPVEIGPPPAPGTYANQDTTTFKDAGCTTDDADWEQLKEMLDGDGTGDVADDTAIWLPDDCKMRAFIDPSTTAGYDLTIAAKYDDIGLICEDPTVCGFEVRYRPFVAGSSPAAWRPWDYTASGASGDVYTTDADDPLKVGAIRIGSGAPSAITSRTWTSGYNLGSKRLSLGSAIATSGGNEWGPGDIVRLSIDDITGSGTADADYMTRVTCADGSVSGTSDRVPAVDPGGLCDELTGDNQIQIEDGLPMNYNPTGLYSGAFAGNSYTSTPIPPGTGGTYAVLSGHTVEQIERAGTGRCDLVATGVCGVGTGTNNVAEGIAFHKVGWSIYPEFIGGRYIGVISGFENYIYGNRLDGRVGGNSTVTLDGNNASHTSLHSNRFKWGAFNTKCYGEIVAIRQTDPVEMDIMVNDSSTCSFAGIGMTTDDWVSFTSDVADPDIAGRVFRKRQGAYTAGTPNLRTITIEGLDGTCGTGICVNTTPGGLAVHMDSFAKATVYSFGSSGSQFVNNRFLDTTQGIVVQSGSMGGVYAYNYERSTEFKNGRGLPFFHGDSYGSSHLMVMNDLDNAFVPLESSNRPPTDNGEGSHHLWYKNRCVATATPDWPFGDDQSDTGYLGGTRGLCIAINEANQGGASNEGWNILLNVGDQMINGAAKIDELSNNVSDFPAVNDAPHLTYSLAWHRNRSASASDHDDNFDGNGTTTRDDSGTDINENAPTRPSAWDSEVGLEPTSIWPKPTWWDCTGGSGGTSSMTFGAMGAYYDAMNGTLGKLPAQIMEEGGTCPGLP